MQIPRQFSQELETPCRLLKSLASGFESQGRVVETLGRAFGRLVAEDVGPAKSVANTVEHSPVSAWHAGK